MEMWITGAFSKLNPKIKSKNPAKIWAASILSTLEGIRI